MRNKSFVFDNKNYSKSDYKNKYNFKKLFRFILIFIILIIFIFIFNICIKEYKFKQTIEYKLSEKGYNNEEIIILKDKLNDNIYDLLNITYDPIIVSLVNEKYYLHKNLKAYLEYFLKNNFKKVDEIIRIVNIKYDNEYTLKTNINLKEKMLVNNRYLLDKNYIPDLVKINNIYTFYNLKMDRIAYENFKLMFDAAKEDGIKLLVTSAYRDYKEQEKIYNNYLKKYGDEGKRLAALPGTSEHQTGYALDIFGYGTTMKTFEKSKEYKWLRENSYKYGYILRYQDAYSKALGYVFEPWHYRYVGVELAEKIYKENISFEEYFAYYIDK